METEGSMPNSQEFSTCPCPEPDIMNQYKVIIQGNISVFKKIFENFKIQIDTVGSGCWFSGGNADRGIKLTIHLDFTYMSYCL
jgi:hypothetical protein